MELTGSDVSKAFDELFQTAYTDSETVRRIRYISMIGLYEALILSLVDKNYDREKVIEGINRMRESFQE